MSSLEKIILVVCAVTFLDWFKTWLKTRQNTAKHGQTEEIDK
jgi:hypothetical protein